MVLRRPRQRLRWISDDPGRRDTLRAVLRDRCDRSSKPRWCRELESAGTFHWRRGPPGGGVQPSAAEFAGGAGCVQEVSMMSFRRRLLVHHLSFVLVILSVLISQACGSSPSGPSDEPVGTPLHLKAGTQYLSFLGFN